MLTGSGVDPADGEIWHMFDQSSYAIN
jgi:hypothetical protein